MRQVSLAGTKLKYFHICAFFNSLEEEYKALTPFFKEGIDQNEQILHIVDPELVDQHRSHLSSNGIDPHECEACGQLTIVDWNSAYLDDAGVFNKKRMLDTIARLTQHGGAPGYDGVRIMGNMGWVFRGTPGAEEVLEYEAEVNQALEQNKQPAVCVYDIAKLTGSMMMDLLRAHPLTLINGIVQENPFYTPPEELLHELKSRDGNQAGG